MSVTIQQEEGNVRVLRITGLLRKAEMDSELNNWVIVPITLAVAVGLGLVVYPQKRMKKQLRRKFWYCRLNHRLLSKPLEAVWTHVQVISNSLFAMFAYLGERWLWTVSGHLISPGRCTKPRWRN